MADRLALATIPSTAPAVTPEHLQLIRTTIAKDATPAELELFLYDCARQGVHPLDKLIHFTKRSGKYTPVTSIDFLRIRAAESGECAGIDDPVFAGTPKQKDFEATVTVHRLVQGTRYPFTATARWTEYKPDQAFMWEKMPFTMLGKCAEALALRKGFPKQLAGLYVKEEMDQAEKINPPASAHSTRALVEPAGLGATAAPADQNDKIPESWRPFVTGEAMTGTIADVRTEGKEGKKAGQPHTYIKTTVVLANGVEFYKIDDPGLTAHARAHQANNERVTILARETARGHEIQSLQVATDEAF